MTALLQIQRQGKRPKVYAKQKDPRIYLVLAEEIIRGNTLYWSKYQYQYDFRLLEVFKVHFYILCFFSMTSFGRLGLVGAKNFCCILEDWYFELKSEIFKFEFFMIIISQTKWDQVFQGA